MSTFVGLTWFISSALITMLSKVFFNSKSIASKKIQTTQAQCNSVLKVVVSNIEQPSSNSAMSSSPSSSPSSSSYVYILQSMLGNCIRVDSQTNSRHNIADEAVFEKRKQFFLSIAKASGIDQSSCKIIHVAGTKGKGSNVEYISSGLIGAGKRVGIFSSPHIHTARERIKVGRNLISVDDFTRIGRQTLSLFQSCEWRYVMFDKMLSAALTYFGESKVDYMVLETGIGGRFDSTNCFDHPVACVITSISLDHQALLGNTLEEIAWQKAGIIKPGADVFTVSSQQESVIRVFREECDRKNAKLHIVETNRLGSKQYSQVYPCISAYKHKLDAHRTELDNLSLPIHYRVQLENACLSSAVLQHLGISREGMNSFYWPCRMEAFLLPNRKLVVLDGCHNEDSVIQFLSGLKERYPSRKVLSLFGAGDEKCVDTMLAQVMERSHSVILLRSKHVKAVPVNALWDMLATYSSEIKQKVIHTSTNSDAREQSIDDKISFALDYLNKIGGEDEYVVAVFGSLFVAAEARDVLYKIEPSLFGPSDWVREADPASL